MKSLNVTYETGGELCYAYLDVSDRAAEVLTAPGFGDTAYGAALRMYLMCENYLLVDELQDAVLLEICQSDAHEEFLNTVNNGSVIATFD